MKTLVDTILEAVAKGGRATFGGGCEDIQPTPHTISEVLRG